MDIRREIEAIKKEQVIGKDNQTYIEFRNTLLPNYLIVWRDIVFGYIALIFVVSLITQVSGFPLILSMLGIILGSISIGYCVAYIQLFIHEAAHYGIVKNRFFNDLLSNIFIGSLSGLNIGTYRIIHWAHHKNLGTTNDSEHSYFDALNLTYILETLTGIRVLKVVFSRKKTLDSRSDKIGMSSRKILDYIMVACTLTLHFCIIAMSYHYGYWELSISWILGLGAFFPLFGALRQLLEHRDELAPNYIDYSQKDHGKLTRMFSDGVIDRTFGGAGFNRHLLHHWDPTISYTRLKDVEDFLSDTEIGKQLSQCKTTYIQTFNTLIQH